MIFKNDRGITILLAGTIGTIGALMILAADLIYNLWQGDQLGTGLYFTTYFGVFFFSFWWAGIWVIYQGLKPAGFYWSFLPCTLFAFSQSTINVFRHSSYLYQAVINDSLNSNSKIVVETINHMKLLIRNYTNFFNFIPDVLELILCLWLATPILRGKTHFPRWTALLIPIFPLLLSLLVNVFYKGFFQFLQPFLPSGFIVIIFVVCTAILYKRDRVRQNC